MNKKLTIVSLASALFFSVASFAEEVIIDRVAAIVNSGVVLESEVQELMASVKAQSKKNNQSLPSDKALRVQVTDKLINDAVILQMGERMGIQVSDAQLDETLTNMAQENNLSLEEFRKSVEADGVSYENFRESVRKELITGEVKRSSLRRRIYISPQEVANLISAMKEQKSDEVEYHLGHILIEFPPEPTQEDMNNAKDRANKVIELLENGGDFAEIAIASSGGDKALEGGDWGWKSINEMPTLFSEVIVDKNKNDIIGPIRTGLGFSIVKIKDIRGREVVEIEEVKARHILIEPSIILSEAKAEAMLEEFRQKILAGEADFAELAKEHSDGPTGVKGGDLGWAEARIYDPAFRDALARLEINEIHKPFRTSFGWHIVQLTGRRTLDATKQMNENRAYQMLYQRKFGMESARWIKELRDEAYIEVLGTDN